MLKKIRDFLVDQWLRLHASKQGACVQPVSHSPVLQLEKKKLIPQILMANQYAKKNSRGLSGVLKFAKWSVLLDPTSGNH